MGLTTPLAFACFQRADCVTGMNPIVSPVGVRFKRTINWRCEEHTDGTAT